MTDNQQCIEVTDHAVIRYLERIKGLDIDRIRRKIGPDEVAVLAKAMGKGDYPVNNEFYARVVDQKVITVVPK